MEKLMTKNVLNKLGFLGAVFVAAVGMFEPVTTTRSTSAVPGEAAGAGAAGVGN